MATSREDAQQLIHALRQPLGALSNYLVVLRGLELALPERERVDDMRHHVEQIAKQLEIVSAAFVRSAPGPLFADPETERSAQP
jgi:hypothetical protein